MGATESEMVRSMFKFLACGNGDTILIRAGDEWALVDANLVAGTKRRLEKCVQEHCINRLRFVAVTHFDQDHLRGMADFLRSHFGPGTERADGSLRSQWELGQLILPVPVGDVTDNLGALGTFHARYRRGAPAEAATYCAEAASLFELAIELESARRPVGSVRAVGSYPPGSMLEGASRFGSYEVIFLAPDPAVASHFVRWFRRAFGAAACLERVLEEGQAVVEAQIGAEQVRAARRWLEALRRKIAQPRFWDARRSRWNASSMVIALRDPETGQAILLCGDLPRHRWRLAAEAWRKFCAIGSSSPETVPAAPFDIVKASHHGSGLDHAPALYEALSRGPGQSWVVVSARPGDTKHPCPKAVGDWRKHGWLIAHTARNPLPRRGFPGGKRPQTTAGVVFSLEDEKISCEPLRV